MLNLLAKGCFRRLARNVSSKAALKARRLQPHCLQHEHDDREHNDHHDGEPCECVHTRPFAYWPMTRLSLAIRTMHTMSTGSNTPLMTCASIMTPKRSTLGISTIPAERMVMPVMMARYAGASFQLRSTPRSQPKASHTALAVMLGSTHAARNDAPARPAAKSAEAYWPASGTSACAASAALFTVTPAG